MNVDSEIREIKKHVLEISKKLDRIIEDREMMALMKLSEASLLVFFQDEPDIYNTKDLKVRYK